LLADWLDTDPEVPSEKWFKRFPATIVCGESDLVKTFLTANQIPTEKKLSELQSPEMASPQWSASNRRHARQQTDSNGHP